VYKREEILLLSAVVLFSIFGIFLSIDSRRQWEKFKAENGCEAVSYKPAYRVGKSFYQAQTGYLCNDGKTYWR
jgi:hypothetical protein